MASESEAIFLMTLNFFKMLVISILGALNN
jgi:uncharacterized membrane protein